MRATPRGFGPPFTRGSRTTLLSDNLVYGWNDSLELLYYGRSGRLERINRVAREGDPVTPAHIERHRAQVFDRGGPPAIQEIARKSLSSITYPDRFPAFSVLRADRVGNLWVGLYMRPEETRRCWLVLDSAQRWLGEIVLPEVGDLLNVPFRSANVAHPPRFPVYLRADYRWHRTRSAAAGAHAAGGALPNRLLKK